nr:RING finger protein 151 [Paramormyrops kingsleyae]
MSGGYDVEYFVDSPGHDLICPICQGVLRCPVRVGCHHIFCKKCILQWLRRKESCPCCRKPIRRNLIFLMFKLSKSIGRLKVKVGSTVAVQKCSPWLPSHLPPRSAVLSQHPVPV